MNLWEEGYASVARVHGVSSRIRHRRKLMNQLRVRPLIQGKCIHVSRKKVESGPTAARLMKRGRTSATIGHDESAVSRQQHPLWREAAAPVVAKAIYGKITFLPEGGLEHFERNT